MSRNRLASVVAVTIASTLVLTACGSTSDDQHAAAESRAADPNTVFEDGPSSAARSSTSSAAPTPSVVPKPTPATVNRPNASFDSTIPLADAAGYTVDIKLNFSLAETWDKSIVNDKPGQATATMKVPFSATATNTTPGRTAPGVMGVMVKGLYPVGSRPCEVDPYEARFEERTKDEQFCIVTLAVASHPPTLAPGGSGRLQPPFNDKTNGVLTMNAVPEESFAEITKAMSNPVGLFVQPLFWESGPVECRIETNKEGNGYSKHGSFNIVYLVAARTPGLPCQ